MHVAYKNIGNGSITYQKPLLEHATFSIFISLLNNDMFLHSQLAITIFVLVLCTYLCILGVLKQCYSYVLTSTIKLPNTFLYPLMQ